MILCAVNETRQRIIAQQVQKATSLGMRLRGLLGRSSLLPGEGLYLCPCQSIHMFFMRFPIDAVFLSQEGCVVHIENNLPPWRLSAWVRHAQGVLELPAGTIQHTGTRMGDRITLNPAP